MIFKLLKIYIIYFLPTYRLTGIPEIIIALINVIPTYYTLFSFSSVADSAKDRLIFMLLVTTREIILWPTGKKDAEL